MKILVWERDRTVADLLQSPSLDHGYEFDAVMGGHAKVSSVESQSDLERMAAHHDLIVLDATVQDLESGLDGLGLCQKLRAKGTQTPILLMMAPEERRKGIIANKVGADDYVTKPFDPETLLARIEFLLSRIGHSPQLQKVQGPDSILQRLATHVPGIHQYVLHPDGSSELTYVSPQCREVWELEPEELLHNSDKAWAMVHPDDIAHVKQALGRAVQHLERFEMEFRLLPPTGVLRWVRAISQPERLPNGDVLFDSFMWDVSDRKQTEFKLQDRLHRERIIAEITDSIHQTLDLKQILHIAVDQVRHFLQTDRVIVFQFRRDWQGFVVAESVAPSLDKILGTKIRDNCLGELCETSYPKGRVSAVSDVDADTIDAEHRELLKAFQVRANLVVPILQGETLWGLLIAHHCRAPRQWSPENTVLLQQVATQMGIAIQQAELYRKTREQAALIDIATDAIFVRDIAGHILFWSHGAERLYGWKAREAIGQITHQLLKKRDRGTLQEALKTTLERGFWQGELTQSTKAGKEILVASRWTLVRDDAGRPQSLLEVNTDITEKKQHEAQYYQAQRLESLGQLAGGIAHDLNNVLTPILGVSQLLRMTLKEIDSSTQKQLDLLEKSAKRGANMVQQILTFARGSPHEETTVDIIAVLQEVVDVARQGFSNSIKIRQTIASAEGDNQSLMTVSADSTYLHQVFMNLCINARDAMPDGGTLTLSVENTFVTEIMARKNLDMSTGHYVVVTVADTGTGIAPEVRDRIFDPFFTTKAPDKGTGLGLATVLGIVKKAGGFLHVDSEVDQGTQIQVYLPAIE